MADEPVMTPFGPAPTEADIAKAKAAHARKVGIGVVVLAVFGIGAAIVGTQKKSAPDEPQIKSDSLEGRTIGAIAIQAWFREVDDSIDEAVAWEADGRTLSVRIRNCNYDHLKMWIEAGRTFREALRSFKFKAVICGSYEGSRVQDFMWR